MSRLENLERAEDLVIALLEAAAGAVGELKEVQASSTEKVRAFTTHCSDYMKNLKEIRDILNEELNSMDTTQAPPARRPGVDKLAIAHWEAKVIADNIHELLQIDNQ